LGSGIKGVSGLSRMQYGLRHDDVPYTVL